MLNRALRPVGIALCAALLSLSFPIGANADERSHAMVEQILPPLHEVHRALTHRDELKPDDWNHIVGDLEVALDMLHAYQRQSP
jgi:hypothetical protein